MSALIENKSFRAGDRTAKDSKSSKHREVPRHLQGQIEAEYFSGVCSRGFFGEDLQNISHE